MHSRYTLHTLGTLWAHSEHTLGHPGHTMGYGYTLGALWAHTGPNHDWFEVWCPQSIESHLLSPTTQDFIRLSSLAFVLNSEHQKSFWQS